MRQRRHEPFDDQPCFRVDEQVSSGLPVRNVGLRPCLTW